MFKNVHNVHVIRHESFVENPLPRRPPTFYFEVEPSYKFPPTLRIKNRGVFISKCRSEAKLGAPSPVFIVKQLCKLIMENTKEVS